MLERPADGVVERAERQARCERSRDVSSEHAGRVQAVQPQRQLHPLAHALLGEELGLDPDRSTVVTADPSTRLDELAPRDAGMRRVERARLTSLAEVDDPGAEVASVDELDLPVRGRGND